MKYEHKAIIDAATREGKMPMEKARELMGHDLLKSMVSTISSHAVAFKNMTEQQQDSAIQQMQSDLDPAIDTAVRLIVSQATKTVRMKLKKVAIGKKWQIVGEAEGDEEYLHELADKTQDQSDVLVLLYERDYMQGLDAIHGEKDQRSLPLDEKAPAGKKPAAKGKGKAATETKIELTPKLVTDGRDFVTIQQNASIAGLQNHLKIGFAKAEALLKLYEGEGLVKFVGTDETGQYELVREPKTESVNTGTANGASGNPDQYGELTYSEVQQTIVLRADKFPLEWLSERFKIDEEQGSHLALRLMDDGVIEAIQPEDLDADAHEYKVIAKLEDLVI